LAFRQYFFGLDEFGELGDFSHLETTSEAGFLADEDVYNEPTFQGYSVLAGPYGISPGVHFIFEYIAQEIGQTILKLYSSSFASVLDSVDITIRDMGTAFIYQEGSFNDAGSPADGLFALTHGAG
jgi:hypothetical protein